MNCEGEQTHYSLCTLLTRTGVKNLFTFGDKKIHYQKKHSKFTELEDGKATHSNVLLELLKLPRGAVASTQILEEAAGEHGVQLQEEVVDSQVEVEIELSRGQT